MDLKIFEQARNLTSQIFKHQLKKFRQNNFNGDRITIGIMPLFYKKYGLKGVLKAGIEKFAKIRDKHPEAWKHIDNIMNYIENPMMIMKSQNINDTDSIIILSDIVCKDVREKESIIGYILRPYRNDSVMISAYSFNHADINKHMKGLRAVDKEKVESVSRVGVTDKALAISIMNTLSTADSIADLKNIVK